MFFDKLVNIIESHSTCVCCGIDPRIKEIEERYRENPKYWIPPSLVETHVSEYGTTKGRAKAVETFSKKLINAVDDHVAVYKPNFAYFATLGIPGIQALLTTIDYIHKKTEKLVILDVKLNDIGVSALHYGIAFFDRFNADAITLNPYLGTDTLTPLLDYFVENGKGIFVLCKTSNPSSSEFQDKILQGSPLFEEVAKKVKEWGGISKNAGGWANIGAVVGATYPKQLVTLRKILDNHVFLIPGLGIQGGEPTDVARLGTTKEGLGAIFNSSRSIDFAYQKLNYTEKEWEKAARESVKSLKQKINSAIEEGG